MNISTRIPMVLALLLFLSCEKAKNPPYTFYVSEFNRLDDNPEESFDDKRLASMSLQDLSQAYRSVSKNQTITHFYVKFKPSNDSELNQLRLNSTNLLSPVHLDECIADFYDYPFLTDQIHSYEMSCSDLNSQYSIVSVDAVLPDLPVEILAELIITHNN